MALVVGRGGRAVRRVHGGPSIRPRAPVSQPAAGVFQGGLSTSQPSSETPRNSACGAPWSLAGPAKIRGRCVVPGTPLRPRSGLDELPKKVKSSGLVALLGALRPRPGAADPRAGDDSQFPAVTRSGRSRWCCLNQSVPSRRITRLGAQERRCPCSGRHRRAARDAASQKLSPNRQPTTRIHSPAAGPTRRARATPAVMEENIVNEHILRRCYCADTCDSLRCDARSTRRAAGTRAPPQNTHRAYRTPVHTSDTRLVSRNGAGVGGVASKHSVVAPARQRPDSEPGTIPPVRFFGIRRGGRDTPGARVQRGV